MYPRRRVGEMGELSKQIMAHVFGGAHNTRISNKVIHNQVCVSRLAQHADFAFIQQIQMPHTC